MDFFQAINLQHLFGAFFEKMTDEVQKYHC